MLNDRIINAAQKLIKNKFPQVGGLQDPVLSQTSFECCPGEGVQIYHTGKTHWIASGNTYLNEVSFDQSKMRNHLFGCFERGEISLFPHSCGTGTLLADVLNELVIQTFCMCCLPEYGDMVQCNLCDNWYHLPCLDLSSCPEDDRKWLCDLCALSSSKHGKKND